MYTVIHIQSITMCPHGYHHSGSMAIIHILAGVPGVARVNKVKKLRNLVPPRHSICPPKHFFPSVKSPLLVPLLLPLPFANFHVSLFLLPPSPPSHPPRCPPPHLPHPVAHLPVIPLPVSHSPSPPVSPSLLPPSPSPPRH